MKKIILVLNVMTSVLGITSELRAESCPIGKKVCKTGCIDEALTCGYCGSTCGYTLVDGVVTLYGTGTIGSGYKHKTINNIEGYYDSNDNPSPFYNNKSIISVKADESSNFTSVANSAFKGANSLMSIEMQDITSIQNEAFMYTKLESIYIPNITSIGAYALAEVTSLESIDISNVTSVGREAFYYTDSLADIIISDETNIANWDPSAFRGLSTGANITCLGDISICNEKLAKYYRNSNCPVGLTCTCVQYCISPSKVTPASESQCTGKYVWNETKSSCNRMTENQCNDYRDENGQRLYYYNGLTCTNLPKNGRINCVNSSYKENDGYCDRIRYTPAEAAAVLHSDNTNSVTITFKK